MSKPKINGFALFMREKRKELEAPGQKFEGGWKEVAAKLDEGWRVWIYFYNSATRNSKDILMGVFELLIL
jgi:hypothetical protein